MEDFLVSPVFQYVVFPIGSVVLGVAVKYVTRNDQYSRFVKEDLAVGLDLALTAVLTLIVLTANRAAALVAKNKELNDVLNVTPIDTARATKLQSDALSLSRQQTNSLVLILLMFVALWAISTLVRKKGWKSATSMNSITGIALPLVFGVISFIAVMAGVTK